MLNDRLVKAVRDNCVARGVQVRNEQMLARYNFQYVPTEGCWVRPLYNARVYTIGANWVLSLDAEVRNSGAGPAELETELLATCG